METGTLLWTNKDPSTPYEESYESLQDAIADLPDSGPGEIVIVGTLQRWDASHKVYRGTGTGSLSRAVEVALGCFEQLDLFELRLEDGNLRLYQWGHDNPTSPSIMDLRIAPSSLSELEILFDEDAPAGAAITDYIIENTEAAEKYLSADLTEEVER